MIPKSDGIFIQVAVKARGIELVEFSILYLHCQAMKLNNEKSIFYNVPLYETSTD